VRREQRREKERQTTNQYLQCVDDALAVWRRRDWEFESALADGGTLAGSRETQRKRDIPQRCCCKEKERD